MAALGGSFDEALAARIRVAAGGNPLFVEEMTAMVSEAGGGEVVVPPTVQALLAARLDQLDGEERSVLERGAVEGQVFHRGAVHALGAETGRLSGLVRKELVRPEATQFTGDDAYRFRHILIRDAAYDALPKATRAELHERFADWLEPHGGELVERDEILGYHLEQAYRYRAELGPVDESGRALAARVAQGLADAAATASLRRDFRASSGLLERAVAVLPDDDPEKYDLEITLVRDLFAAGDFERAGALIDRASRFALERGDARLTALAQIEAVMLRTFVGGVEAAFDVGELDEPIAALERLGDEVGVAKGLSYLARLRFYKGQAASAMEGCDRAIEIARRHGLLREEREWRHWMLAAKYYGPSIVAEVAEYAEGLSAGDIAAGNPESPNTMLIQAAAYAMRGEFEAARELIALALPIARELGLVPVGMIGMAGGQAELLAGAPERAEQLLRESWDGYGALGETGFRSTVGTMLAQTLVELGRDDEAELVLDEVATFVAGDDFDPEVRRRWVRALILARRGRHAEAERLAREAVELVEPTDYLQMRADARVALATVLDSANREAEAGDARARALALYEQKGITVRVAELRAKLG